MDSAVLELVRVALTILGCAGGAWLAVRVEIRWLRADITRHEHLINLADGRIRHLERKGVKYVASG